MFLGERNYLLNNIWAEDGLFVMCFEKSSFYSCTFDSYSGYLLFYPRLIAYIVSFFPLGSWPLVNNILYLVVIFLLTYLIFTLLILKYSKYASVLISLSPFILAISSDQILGVHSSLYLIASAYLVVIISTDLWTFNMRPIQKYSLVVLIFLNSVSTPFGLIILFVLLVKLAKNINLFQRSKQIVILSILGCLIQFYSIFTANEVRSSLQDPILVLKNSFNFFIKSVISIFYYPAESRLDDTVFLQQTLVSFLYSNPLLLITIGIILFIIPLFLKSTVLVTVQIISLSSWAVLLILLVSSYTFGWPYRFIALVSVINIWIIINIFESFQNKLIRIFSLTLLTITLALNLSSNFSISSYRSAGPEWRSEVEKKIEFCTKEENFVQSVSITFYPNWPTINPHAHGLSEPTTNKISCQQILNSL